ncbi:hypothetical protein MHYP_G00057670 [Metynnis hypsauchen]
MRPGRRHCLRETMKKRFITLLTCLLGLIISSSPSPRRRVETAGIGPVYPSPSPPAPCGQPNRKRATPVTDEDKGQNMIVLPCRDDEGMGLNPLSCKVEADFI